MGDFNTDWEGEKTLKHLVEKLDLHAFNIEDNTPTFTKRKKRLDWILISKELDFLDYEVLHDQLSDHKGVIAKVGYSNFLR